MLTEQENRYIELAYEYLRPVKLVETQIESIKQEINLLRSNVITIGAIDYSKDKVCGGGTPQGLEGSIAKFLKVDPIVKAIFFYNLSLITLVN